MKAIVTVIGQDKVGIIAAVCSALAEKNVNILDISQTILGTNFTMIMAVDAENCNCSFDALADSLAELGHSMELTIHTQREEIFNAMHRV